MLVRLEFVEPRVLQVARDRFVDQGWRQPRAIGANRSYNRDPLSTAVLPGSCEGASLVQLSCEDPASLLQLADEEAFLVHIVDIVSTYIVFLHLLTNNSEVSLVVASGVSFVPCEI